MYPAINWSPWNCWTFKER